MNKWKYDKLSNLCTRIGDGLHGTPVYSDDSDIFFINGNNLKNGKIEITENTSRISSEELENNFIPLNSNSLLLSINGTLGSMAFYNNEKVMLGKSAAYLNFKSEINRFYYYYFQLPHIQQYFYNVATGSTIKNLSLKSIQDFEVPIPELNEWKCISDVLSSLDSKIELNNRINAELEAMAKTIYDYWFVQFDFPNKEGKPYKTSGGKMVWNEELKREIPEGWEIKRIGEVAIIKAGGDKPINYSIEKTEFNNVPIYSNGITNDGLYGYTNKPIISEQCVTISARGTIGFCVLRNKPFVPIIRLIVLTPNLTGSAKYFFEVLKHFNFENSGSVQQQLTVPQVKDIKLLYPNEYILKKFDDITLPMKDRIEIIKEENQKLSELRDWLLPMLMNGQVKVE